MASRGIWQSPLFFLAVWALSSVFYQSLGGMWSSIITTVEEVFHLTSFQSGTLTIVDYFAGLWISLPLVYYGQHQHRPRFIGAVTILTAVGAFIQAFPHLLYRIPVDELIDRNNGGPNIEVCNRSNAIENGEDRAKECDVPEQEHSFFFGPCIWFFIGRIITSCYGAVYPIALVYLDDGVPKRSIVLYAGFITTIYAIGFTVGYFVASAVLSLPLYLTGLDEDVDTSKLPGAWWLGYVILSSLAILTAIPFFWFPASLPTPVEEAEDEPLLNQGETTKGASVLQKEEPYPKEQGLSEVTSSTKDFFKSLWRVVTNPIIFLMAISGGFFILGSETLATFAPLYAEEYYRLSPSQAAVLTGAQAVFGYVIGQLLGAALLRYLDLNRLQSAVFYNVGLTIYCIGITSAMFIYCAPEEIVGLSHQNSTDTASLNISLECNVHCSCPHEYRPVCGAGVSYLSPCYAGCSESISEDKSILRFTNCSCVTSHLENTQRWEQNRFGDVELGLCKEACSSWIYYAVIAVLSSFALSAANNAPLIMSLRSVAEQDRSLMFSFLNIAFRIIGFIPGPIIAGWIIDQACIIFSSTCEDSSGNCILYDTQRLPYLFFSMPSLCSCATLILITIILFLLRRQGEKFKAGNPS
ncbi:Solute carrier organic anion transporter family member 2B1 [Holothuria leucospilota]|uniref:Solute carrier organic anion transporter family member n=1 Tax=Holothuria leucospilota TaxID=206669 RepID=A0A9Q1CGR4_HOLLE|nr:Solute carrier organic anion transporter family member 2B1 [Holothuria leucospilota]